MYTATRNQSDRNFEIGKKYKCVKIDKPQHFHMNLQKDGSTLKFVNPEGIEMGYFGSVATGYFTDNTNEISEALNQYMKYANDSIESSKGEMGAKLSIVINHIKNIKKASISRNELIERAKEHGLTINSSITDIDGFAIDSQINALKAVTANLEKAIIKLLNNLELNKKFGYQAQKSAFDKYESKGVINQWLNLFDVIKDGSNSIINPQSKKLHINSLQGILVILNKYLVKISHGKWPTLVTMWFLIKKMFKLLFGPNRFWLK
jgi:hypothetical protein